MVNPTALTSLNAGTGSTADPNGPFFTDVSLRLNGRVTVGDVWTLGIRYRDYNYKVVAGDTLATIAQHLGELLPARYDVDWTTTPGVLMIHDSLGFNLTGLTANGISQKANAAATITRIQTAKTTGNADVTFTTATVSLGGTAAAGETWTLVIDDTGYDKPVCNTDDPPVCTTDLTQIASALAGLVTGATPNGSTITITRATPFRLAFRISGPSPQGTATFDGTPTQTQAPVITWTTERFELPATLRQGETWAIQITGGASASRVVSSTDTPTTVAQVLATGLGTGASSSGGTVTYQNASGFTANITVTPSGTKDVDLAAAGGGSLTTKTVTLTDAFQANDVWQVTLSDGGNTTYGTGTASGTNLDTVALNLATSISAITGFEAVSKGSTIVITRTAGGTFTVTLSVSPADSMSIASTATRVVNYAQNATTGNVTVGGTAFSSGTQSDVAHVTSALATAINASGIAFAAVSSGRDLFIIARSVTSFTPTSTNGTVDTHTFAGKAAALSGTPSSGDTWTLSLTDDRRRQPEGDADVDRRDDGHGHGFESRVVADGRRLLRGREGRLRLPRTHRHEPRRVPRDGDDHADRRSVAGRHRDDAHASHWAARSTPTTSGRSRSPARRSRR